MGFETWVPHLPSGQHLNKPLSFISAPAFQALALGAAGSLGLPESGADETQTPEPP